MSTPRKEAKARSRQALIDAGLRLFHDQGLDGPSLDAICAEAGYTRGAFYGHFADREAFLVEVMKYVGAPIVETLASGSEDDGIAEIGARFLAAFADGSYPLAPSGGIRPHQLFAACARSPVLGKHYVALATEAIDRLEAAIESDKARGRVRADLDSRAVASSLLMLVVGAQSLAEVNVELDLGRIATQLLVLLSRPPDQ